MQVADEKGKYAFGYHSDMAKYGPKAQLKAGRATWDYAGKNTSGIKAQRLERIIDLP